MHRVMVAILLLILTISLMIPSFPILESRSTSADIDAYGKVVYIVDGDTIDVMVVKIYDLKYSSFLDKKIRIRFADINAPEINTYKGVIARQYLYNLIYGKYVYLDIDDLYTYDKYGRVIAVTYLPINRTHLLNINLNLVIKNYAEIRNYPNEFNPYAWTLYVVLPTVVTTTLPTPIYIPPTIVTTSLNINVTKVTELNLGRYSEIIYIQPCLCENSIIRIATVCRHQNIYLLKVIDINGTDLISLQFSAPNYLTSCIRTSHDLAQLLIPAITDDGSTTFMAINMCSLTIKRIDTPISANNYGYICTSLTPIHSGIATFKSPNSSRTVAILNITSGNLSLYKLNINQSISKPLLSTPSTLITILGSGIYDLVVYDLIKNSSVRFLSCDVVGLCHVSAKYVVLGCTSWSRRHTYQSYMVLNLIDRSYRMIPTYESLTYNALIAIELSRGEVVMGYTTEAPFGIGGPAIYVMMLTNGKTLSWYKSVNLTNYVAGAGYGKVTTFGNYVALLLKHEEGQPYYTSSSLINKLALLVVNPYSGAIGISHVNSINDEIIWDFSYVVENYEFIPIVKEEHVYLEIFSIEAFEKPCIVTLISKSYVNTIATLTTTRTETKYLYYTKTSTKTIEKTIMRTKELTHTVYIYTTAYPYEITKTMYITLYRPITSISTVTRTKTVTLEIIKTVPSLTRPAMEIIALLGAAAVAIATTLLLAITIVRRK